ncbi:hypothetical protein CNMCM8927_001255 [Aspergillus lentulus]|uniref:Uncharacterized protein n=1 Tax=Aspergillus lentulus TaxID=293939 RepID=A0AAN5YHG9_ASPLE|nr:hypothetical protein CNMCM6069_000394 [Aspergillus lentulus]KAF4201711.1 hypothetical protein CNMCM8927_001255 [Aspergillus lentulus]
MVSLQTAPACQCGRWKPPRQPRRSLYGSYIRHRQGRTTSSRPDVFIISEMDRIVAGINENETKADFLVMSAGFMPFGGRKGTREGLIRRARAPTTSVCWPA